MPEVSRRGRGRRTMSQINMVPFIDVMLVLLIIFMVTAPLITPSHIALPRVGQAATQPEHFVHVLIDKDERLQVRAAAASGDTPTIPLSELAARVQQLQAAGPSAPPPTGWPVLISADKRVPYAAVVQVMDALQRAGISRIGLSVQAGD